MALLGSSRLHTSGGYALRYKDRVIETSEVNKRYKKDAILNKLLPASQVFFRMALNNGEFPLLLSGSEVAMFLLSFLLCLPIVTFTEVTGIKLGSCRKTELRKLKCAKATDSCILKSSADTKRKQPPGYNFGAGYDKLLHKRQK